MTTIFDARRKPIHLPGQSLTRADADVLNRAGLTLTEWDALTDEERADYRWRLGA